MDNVLSVKPGATLRGPFASRDPMPVRPVADTELDPSKTVAAVDRDRRQQPDQQGGDARDDRRGHPEHAPAEAVVVDPETQDRLFRERDVCAELREHPDQAMQRQRAYGHSPAAGGPRPHADIEA